MSDLIRRLRLNGDENIALGDDKWLYIEAADEITRLTAELEQAQDRGPGTLYARVAAIGEFSEKHCGHSPYSAKPAELTLTRIMKESHEKETQSPR